MGYGDVFYEVDVGYFGIVGVGWVIVCCDDVNVGCGLVVICELVYVWCSWMWF